MAGIVIPILRKATFDFSYLSGGEQYNRIIHNALGVVPFSECTLMVRVHTNSAQTNGQINIILRDVDPSPNDSQDFVIDSTDYLSQSVNSTDAAPKLLKTTSTSSPGPYLRVIVQGKNTGGAGPVTNVMTLSADLVARAT